MPSRNRQELPIRIKTQLSDDTMIAQILPSYGMIITDLMSHEEIVLTAHEAYNLYKLLIAYWSEDD